MTHKVMLKSIEPVTPDTFRLTVEKPRRFAFRPGQATDLALDRDGWREGKRPFTFTSLPQEDSLQFVIKTYPDHKGVTAQIANLLPGATLLIEEPWGALEDRGDGVFIAGGAGITPFIAILRDKLKRKGTLEGNTLVFSNATDHDIILRREFERMPGLTCHWRVTGQPGSAFDKGKVDRWMLSDLVGVNRDMCYVCGPDPMVAAMLRELQALGVGRHFIVTEDFDFSPTAQRA